jgi:hypothetical protein
LAEINAYPNLNRLKPPKSVLDLLASPDLSRFKALGRSIAARGRVFWEHAAAGEGTRLGLGPKFLIKPSDLDPAWDSSDLCLGLRRLARFVYEIEMAAKAERLDPAESLSRQKILIVASEEAVGEIARRVLTAFGSIIPPENFLFMAQASFLGLNRLHNLDWDFDQSSPRRLYNHGAMAIQKTMDGQVYRVDPVTFVREPLSQAGFFSLLTEFDDCVSLNVEDLDYLTKALDFETYGLSADYGQKGYGVVMEITLNNPDRPIKGGMAAFDEELGRDAVIESFRLKGLEPKDIKLLNKNFNHYPNPAYIFGRLKEEGLFLPAAVLDDRLYFQPVQGDLNFLAKSAFFIRQGSKGINSLKSLADAPAALLAMRAQDRDPKFLAFSRFLEARGRDI